MSKKTEISTPMRSVPPLSGPTSLEIGKQVEESVKYHHRGVEEVPLPQPRSYEGTGVPLGNIKKD